MFRRSYLTFYFVLAIALVAAVGANAQNAPVSGTVVLQANGTKTPVPNALIEVYRTDIKAGAPSTKSDKRGDFKFAGLTIGGSYAFVVSAAGCAPVIYPNVKAGMERLEIVMDPGDGKTITEDEARAALAQNAGGGGGEQTAESKKAQAEFEAKKKEIEARNAKAMSVNEIVNKSMKEGNDAYTAKNYDLAITKYTEGYEADPAYVGSAPVMLNNRGASYIARGTDLYNKNIKSSDPAARAEAKANAKRDFGLAAESYKLAYDVAKNAPAADVADPKNVEAAKFASLRGAKEVGRLSVLTEQVDDKVIAVDKEMLPEYMAVETDSAKKAEAGLILADLFRVGADFENAVACYRKILETSPDNVDALAGAGLSLVNVGYIENNKAKLQEGSNLLQKFVSLAPDTHRYKTEILGVLDTLKKENNVTPQKMPANPKKKP